MLSKGKIVVSDRLHAIILGLLMDKPVVALDNVYKKFNHFYDTFLKDYQSEIKLERSFSYDEALVAILKLMKN